jgi:AraC-like DNA-binding protein
MIQFSPPSPPLRPFIRAYVHCAIRADSALHRPIPARTAPALEFTFGEPYRIHHNYGSLTEKAHGVAIIGSQTHRRVELELFGRIETFIVVFQPAGLRHLFSIPGVELTDKHYDACGVLGWRVSKLASQLSETSTFTARMCIANEFFSTRINERLCLDHVASVAREMIDQRGCVRIANLADQTGLGLRQFERKFTHEIGTSPKMYARIARFEAAVSVKTRLPKMSWTDVACDLGYYDQMHMVHDFRRLSGASPTSIAAQLEPFVEEPAKAETLRGRRS